MENNSFTVDQKILSSVLLAMQPICSKRTTLDTTSSVLFQAGHKELIVKSTDLEISLQYSCAVKESNVEEGQLFLVSGKRLFDLVKELDGDIQFDFKNNQISLFSGSAQLSLNTKSHEEFPPFPERIENLMKFDTSFLLSMLDKVAFLIPQNNSNPALNGLLLEISNTEFKMTATDGHCLAQAISPDYTLEESKSWLLPRRAVFELKKIMENIEDTGIFLGICGNQLVFSGESFNFFTKILADPFPQYQPILAKAGFNKGSINRAYFIKALRRANCMLSGQFIATKFDFKGNGIDISMSNKDVGSFKEEVIMDESAITGLSIRFYAPYLLNGLQAFGDEKITFYLNNSSSPMIFESIDQTVKNISFTYLAMPVSPSHNN